LQIVSNLVIKRNEASPKKAYIYVRVEVAGYGSRRVGTVTLNLGEFRNRPVNEVNFKVESNLDRNCFMRLSITSVRLEDSMINDHMSEVSHGGASSEGHDFEFSGLLPNLEQDISGLEEKKPSRPPTVVINKARTMAHKREAVEEEPLLVLEELQSEVKRLKAQLTVSDKDVKHITKERNQLQISLSMAEAALTKEKDGNSMLMKALEEQLKLNTQHFEERLKKTEAELDYLHMNRQALLTELETSEALNAGLKLEISDLQLKTETVRQQGHQSAFLERELEMRNAKVLRLSKELDKVLAENFKLIQAVSTVKSLLEGGKDSAESRLLQIIETLTQLDYSLERTPAETQVKSIKPPTDPIIAEQSSLVKGLRGKVEFKPSIESIESDDALTGLKAQLEETASKLTETTRALETERMDRTNIERRLKAKLEEYEKKCSRMSIESVQIKERQTQLGMAIEQHLDSREKASDTSTASLMSSQLDKQKAALMMYKQERQQMKRTLDSLQADNQELRQELSEARQQLVEVATRNSDDEGKLIVKQLKNKLDDQVYCFTVEKSQLTDRVLQLEAELEVLELQKNAQISALEQEAARVHVLQTEQSDKSGADSKWQQLLTGLRLENSDVQDQLTQMESERIQIESMLMQARAGEKKREKDLAELTAKFSKSQDQLYDLRSQNSMLERELINLNERLGNALNANNELEEQIMALRRGKRTR
jgi:chromosome segregation ATPase